MTEVDTTISSHRFNAAVGQFCLSFYFSFLTFLGSNISNIHLSYQKRIQKPTTLFMKIVNG